MLGMIVYRLLGNPLDRPQEDQGYGARHPTTIGIFRLLSGSTARATPAMTSRDAAGTLFAAFSYEAALSDLRR